MVAALASSSATIAAFLASFAALRPEKTCSGVRSGAASASFTSASLPAWTPANIAWLAPADPFSSSSVATAKCLFGSAMLIGRIL